MSLPLSYQIVRELYPQLGDYDDSTHSKGWVAHMVRHDDGSTEDELGNIFILNDIFKSFRKMDLSEEVLNDLKECINIHDNTSRYTPLAALHIYTLDFIDISLAENLIFYGASQKQITEAREEIQKPLCYYQKLNNLLS